MDWAFGTALRVYGGEDAVRPLPAHALVSRETESEGVTAAAQQLSWEEYKGQRQAAREERKEGGLGLSSSLGSWFGKEKKD